MPASPCHREEITEAFRQNAAVPEVASVVQLGLRIETKAARSMVGNVVEPATDSRSSIRVALRMR